MTLEEAIAYLEAIQEELGQVLMVQLVFRAKPVVTA